MTAGSKTGPVDPDRERSIIARVRGDGQAPENMSQIAASFDPPLSRERVRQIVVAYEARTGEKVRPVRPPPAPPEPRSARAAESGTPHSRMCTKCGAEANTAEEVAALFYPRRKNGEVVGYREACKRCSKAAATEYLRLHPERQDKWRSYYAKRGLVKGAKRGAD